MYPPTYRPQTNFVQQEQLGLGVSAAAVQAEYARVAESISHVIALIKRITTSDGRLKLDQAVRLRDVITEVDFGTGDGVTTVFAFTQEIDAGVDTVRTFLDGVRTDPDSFTDTDVTFAVAPDAGVAVTGFVYMNVAGVMDRLQSVVTDEGAGLIGIEDAAANFDAANVEDALAELATDLDNLITALGDIDQFVLRNGTRTLTGQWEINERALTTTPSAAAVGSFRLNAQPADGEYIVINDGVLQAIYEFNSLGFTAQLGAVEVVVGATVEESAQNLLDVINAGPIAIQAELSGQNFTLTHEIPYALGNQALVASGAAFTALIGMAGGVDGSFGPAFRTHYRLRNMPRSLRDGDAVVHEQLNDIIGVIEAALTSFLRLDGANEMVGALNMGGNKVINADDGVAPTDLATVGQMDAAIAAEGATKLSLIGTKDTVAEGTITGPITLGRLASATADADQTTTPATVATHTISGVPKPSAGDQVANKQFVDDAIAALVIGESTGFASFDIEGDGVGGAGLVPGGEFYYDDLNIAAAQALTMPIRLYCRGTFTLENTGSIISTAPVEIIAVGAIVINGVIQCPHLTIRGGSTLSITAAISCHAALGSLWKKYPYVVPSLRGYPVGTGVNVDLAYIWRAVLIDAVGAISITAAVTADDIFIKGGSTVTISSTFTARWLVSTGTWYTLGTTDRLGWHDGYKDHAINSAAGRGPGGTGGTGGGAGSAGTGVSSGNSTYYGGNRPYLLENYALARGSFGGRNSPAGTPSGDSQHGRGGGRISIYAEGTMTLTAAGFFATGGDGDEIFGGGNDGGGGGGGSVRLVCKGTMVDGAIDASGGTSPDVTGGGGGLAAMIAAGYSGVQSRVVTPGAGGTAGTSVAITLPAATIDGLKQQQLFEVLPNAA
jgi:hypothetical protein